MPLLKLSVPTSLCAKACNWPRTRPRPRVITTTTKLSATPLSTMNATSCNSARWWRIITCAHPAHDTSNPYYKRGLLGFNRARNVRQCFSVSSSNSGSGSAENKGIQGEQQQQQQLKSSNLLTLPTILTLGRVAAVPLLIGTFYMDSWWGTTATTTIFIAASITDWLDGYLARKMRLKSSFGAFLDPVADKLMVAATLVLLCSKPLEVGMLGQVPWLLTVPSIAIIGREITMSAVREWAASQNTKLLEAVAVNNLGKWKTATQMTALTILLATRDSSLGAPAIVVASGAGLLYVSAGLAVMSLAVYMKKISKVLLR